MGYGIQERDRRNLNGSEMGYGIQDRDRKDPNALEKKCWEGVMRYRREGQEGPQ